MDRPKDRLSFESHAPGFPCIEGSVVELGAADGPQDGLRGDLGKRPVPSRQGLASSADSQRDFFSPGGPFIGDRGTNLVRIKMATHSSVLAWRIPGMVEAGGLPSMGLHRLGYN